MIRCFNGRRGTRELRRATRPPSRKLSSCPCSHLSPKPSGRPALGRQALESSTRSYPRRCGPRSSPRLPVLKLQRLRSRLHRYLVGLGFVLPAAVYIVVFFGYPLVYNLAMSFQDYTPRSFYTGEAPFVGLDNYRKIVSSPIFQPAVLHTIVFTVGS